jgi:hypothetical protein
MNDATLFFPCTLNPRTGRISERCTRKPMSHDDACRYLVEYHRLAWLRCEAIPQPVGHPYFYFTGRI